MSQGNPNKSKSFTYKPLCHHLKPFCEQIKSIQAKANTNEFCLRLPRIKICFFFATTQPTRLNVERMNTHFFVSINSPQCWNPNEAKLITHAEALHNWDIFLWPEYTLLIIAVELSCFKKPNIYMQTKPNPLAHCSWEASERFLKKKGQSY